VGGLGDPGVEQERKQGIESTSDLRLQLAGSQGGGSVLPAVSAVNKEGVAAYAAALATCPFQQLTVPTPGCGGPTLTLTLPWPPALLALQRQHTADNGQADQGVEGSGIRCELGAALIPL